MRFLRAVGHFFKILLIFIFLGAILLFGLSFSGQLTRKIPFLYGENFITLSSGEYPESSAELKAVVSAEDLALLDQFTELNSADFSGSTCYDNIYRPDDGLQHNAYMVHWGTGNTYKPVYLLEEYRLNCLLNGKTPRKITILLAGIRISFLYLARRVKQKLKRMLLMK